MVRVVWAEKVELDLALLFLANSVGKRPPVLCHKGSSFVNNVSDLGWRDDDPNRRGCCCLLCSVLCSLASGRQARKEKKRKEGRKEGRKERKERNELKQRNTHHTLTQHTAHSKPHSTILKQNTPATAAVRGSPLRFVSPSCLNSRKPSHKPSHTSRRSQWFVCTAY